jgi:hypothetical protein
VSWLHIVVLPLCYDTKNNLGKNDFLLDNEGVLENGLNTNLQINTFLFLSRFVKL